MRVWVQLGSLTPVFVGCLMSLSSETVCRGGQKAVKLLCYPFSQPFYLLAILINSQFSYNSINFKTLKQPFPPILPKMFALISLGVIHLHSSINFHPQFHPKPLHYSFFQHSSTPVMNMFVLTYFDHFQNPRLEISPKFP